MPKVSKVASSASSKPSAAAPVKVREVGKFYCTRCTRDFVRQKTNFPGVQSPIYRENGGYLTVCKHCVDDMFEQYKVALGDEKAALRRICMKFDIYWSEKIYAMVYKGNTTTSRVLSYISKANLFQFVNKTFDDTLDEELKLGVAAGGVTHPADSQITEDEEIAVPGEVMEFWGSGFTPSFYTELERRFKYWCGDADRSTMDVSDCAVIRQICMLEVTITRDTAQGKSPDKSINMLNTLLGSANLKPIQKKEKESLDAQAESTPFGVWIRKIENTRPIADPDPELQDVDGIIKYVSVWFFGHLCKMLGITNKYSRMYEEEMARLRVERPEYEGEDDESVLDDIFKRATAKEEEGSGEFDGI